MNEANKVEIKQAERNLNSNNEVDSNSRDDLRCAIVTSLKEHQANSTDDFKGVAAS